MRTEPCTLVGVVGCCWLFTTAQSAGIDYEPEDKPFKKATGEGSRHEVQEVQEKEARFHDWGDDTRSGDRDTRFTNCAEACAFECKHPEASARKLLAEELVQNEITHGKTIIHPSDTRLYREHVQEALTVAWKGIKDRKKLETNEPPPFLQDAARSGLLPSEVVELQPDTVQTKALAIPLWALRWKCEENCRYMCMHVNSNVRQIANEPQVRYYGKPAFLRFLGVQEPLGMIFSLLNGLPFVMFLASDLIASDARMTIVWVFYSLIFCNTWLQSAIFHARQFVTTETLNHQGATMGLAVSIVTALLAHVPENWPMLWPALCLYVPATIFWIYHVIYISFVKFNYEQNLRTVIALGMISSTMWLIWFLRYRRVKPFAWKIVLATWGHYLAWVPHVYFDFPPLFGLLDAHSLWRLLTIPLNFLLCSFIRDNIWFEEERLKEEKKKKA